MFRCGRKRHCMQCKFCNTEMEEGRLYCPECGKRQDVEVQPEAEEKKAEPKKGNLLTIVFGVIAVLAVAALLVVLLLGNNQGNAPAPNSPTNAPTTEATTKEPQGEVTEGAFVENAGTKVAVLDDTELTMDILQMFYATVINSFLEDYGSSLSSFGLDITKSLAEQKYPYEDAENWEEFFMLLAIERWKNCVGLSKLAKEQGFTMDQDMYTMIDEQIASLEELAKERNYTSATAMIQAYYGEACTVESYKKFLTMDTEANAFYYSVIEVTDDQVKDYFAAHKDELAEKKITEDGKLVSAVRHILICPEGGTKSEDGKTTIYSDAEWAAALTEAEKVLKEWKDGEATEVTFSALVKKYTDDEASASTGGLYENVANNNQYVPEFQNWSIDPARKTGDTEIVKTSYGYHIMYFVSGEQEYMYYSRILLQNENVDEMEKALEEHMKDKKETVEYEKITLQNIYEGL